MHLDYSYHSLSQNNQIHRTLNFSFKLEKYIIDINFNFNNQRIGKIRNRNIKSSKKMYSIPKSPFCSQIDSSSKLKI